MTEKPKPETPPAKKRTRKQSFAQLAAKAYEERRKLTDRLDAENARHIEKVQEIECALMDHDTACRDLPPEAREMFERLVGS